MNRKLDTEEVRHLFEGMQQLETTEEYFRFFEDLCTINELLAMAQRYEVAKATGASTATISRVNRSLHYGEDGYAVAFERIAKQEEEK